MCCKLGVSDVDLCIYEIESWSSKLIVAAEACKVIMLNKKTYIYFCFGWTYLTNFKVQTKIKYKHNHTNQLHTDEQNSGVVERIAQLYWIMPKFVVKWYSKWVNRGVVERIAQLYWIMPKFGGEMIQQVGKQSQPWEIEQTVVLILVISWCKTIWASFSCWCSFFFEGISCWCTTVRASKNS
jgi:hypothetical protein